MKILLSIIIGLIVGLIAFIGWYRWDTSVNRGYKHGYFGEINRVSNALVSIPEVAIRKSWHNLDVKVEEFGFDLTVTGQHIRLYFGEADPIREMRREAAVKALQDRIATELSKNPANEEKMKTGESEYAPAVRRGLQGTNGARGVTRPTHPFV